MEQRDLIKDEIERLGKVLAKLLADLAHIRSSASSVAAIEHTDQELSSELGLTLAEVLEKDERSLKDLVIEKKWNGDHLDQLAEILTTMAEDQPVDQAFSYMRKAMEVYEIADSMSKDYSFYRAAKKEALKEMLA